MGKAKPKAIKEYVKLGEKSSLIEIELKGGVGKRNYVIQRTLNHDNSTAFKLDGRLVLFPSIKRRADMAVDL